MIIISSVCFPCLWLQNRHCVVSFGRIGSGFAHTLVKFIAKCSQSFFQVVAVVFFAQVVDRIRRIEQYHAVCTNGELHSIAGLICAERAALMQLKFTPDLECITKIIIVTDAANAISRGMLCWELKASHSRIPWEVHIVLGRSVYLDLP